MALLNYLKEPRLLLTISIALLIFGMLFSKNKMFDCKDIIKMHFRCFKKKTTNRYSFYSLFTAFGIPLILSIALVTIRKLDNDVINILTIIVSILTSMFFTLLTLTLDLKNKTDSNSTLSAREAKLTGKLLREVYYSLMFEIFISIVILILCFIELFAKKYSTISSGILYYMTMVLVINLLVILKRVFAVIKNDIEG
jgi:hypothetical protein